MKRIVLFTYEFTYSPFSGNGILARSLVKSFLGLGCSVTVYCCRPSKDMNEQATKSNDNHLTLSEMSQDSIDRLELLSTSVPSAGWRRVDDQSCWRDFNVSNLCSSDLDHLRRATKKADFVCAIDWSGSLAYQSIQDTFVDDADMVSKFQLYLNFRVYSLGVDDPRRKNWYDEMEYNAMENASVVISLSSKDSEQLSLIQQRKEDIPQRRRAPIEIVLPPLRQDMESFAKTGNSPKDFLCYLPDPIRSRITIYGADSNRLFSKRPLVACVARQSPEKCIHRFVKFAELAADLLQELNLTVVLAGAASDVGYARNVRERLLKAVPSAIVIDRFLSPKELGAVFAHTVLNFHPSSYDAYGMTIVEAAAFGAPTILAGPSVGAFRLLGEDGCLRVTMDESDENSFSESSLATTVKFLREWQETETSWESLSSMARKKALAWDEISYGERILQIVDSLSHSG